LITEREYLKGRHLDFPLSDLQLTNMRDLLERVNKIRALWGQKMIVTSGYRPPAINAGVGGKKSSLHLSCRAIDIADASGRLGEWCLKNLDAIESCGLWLEHPAYTSGWVHLQSAAPRSGKRVFIP
jgi:hypothetical protein